MRNLNGLEIWNKEKIQMWRYCKITLGALLVLSLVSNVSLITKIKTYREMEISFIQCSDDMILLSNDLEAGKIPDAIEWSRKCMDHYAYYAEKYKNNGTGWENFPPSKKNYTPNTKLRE